VDATNTGLLARFRAGLHAFVEALDYSGFDYTMDRIGNAEREIARLNALLERASVTSSNETPNR